jgi:hypothetical protein
MRLIACAVVLMIFGLAIHWKLAIWASDASSAIRMRGWTYISAMPLVAGGILAFLGAVRMSLVVRPVHLLLTGVILVFAAFGGPVLAVQIFPSLNAHLWTGASQVPLWVCDLTGLLFISTGLLRFLSERVGNSR